MELLRRSADSLANIEHIVGAGVYVLYYSGSFSSYLDLTEANRENPYSRPIYVGKAIPKGGRKGGLQEEASAVGRALLERLRQHASSIREASNLTLADFAVRHLILDDIWIPLGENMLIETFKPVWNRALDGFGNKDPGNRRKMQFKSPWDVLHPSREFAEKLAEPPRTAEFFARRVQDYLTGRPLEKLPKELEKQAEVESSEED